MESAHGVHCSSVLVQTAGWEQVGRPLLRTAGETDRRAEQAAVLSMALCVMVLIASEFMPVSLLTPIASDLRITEGQAGQAISISGVFAVTTSLVMAAATARLDRRTVLLSLTGLLIVSGSLVATAPGYAALMLGRALLGIAIGGFWSVSTATVMRLVPEDRVPQELAILNGGNALAATIAAPLGSFVGGLIGSTASTLDSHIVVGRRPEGLTSL